MLLTHLLIVDRRTLFRQALVALLRGEPTLQVVGEIGAVAQARRFGPPETVHLVLLDAAFLADSETERVSVIASLRHWLRGAEVLALGRAGDTLPAESARDEKQRALHVGAAGYLSPLLDREAFLDALRNYVPGQGFSLREQASVPDCVPLPIEEHRHAVTERERDVIRLIAEGLCNKEIAHDLGISTQTVKNHVSHLLQKLELVDRTQLAVYFLEHPVEF